MSAITFLLLATALTLSAAFEIREGTLPEGRSISSVIVGAVENLRDRMPCGWEEYHVPPMAPLKIDQKAVEFNTSRIGVDGEITKLRIDRLNDFDIVFIRASPIKSKVEFEFVWKNITIKSLYKMVAVLQSFGITVKCKGDGVFFVAVTDLKISGSLRYNYKILSQKILLRDFKITVTIGEVVSDISGLLGEGFGNRKLNEFIEEVILLFVNDNPEVISNAAEQIVVPLANSFLDDKRLPDIIAGIGSEKPECVPPEDKP